MMNPISTEHTLARINQKTVVTGDRPTGKLHLGHYVGSLQTRLHLQQEHEVYILIADTQVLNNDVSKAKHVKNNIMQVMRDYLSVGLDPQRVHFFLQSRVHELFELSSYLANIVTLPQVMRNPTIKAENEAYNSQLNIGFLNYPISQTADIVLLDGELVPVGSDQVAILEFGNDVIQRFHHLFDCQLFKHICPLLSDNNRLCGVDGQAKMSKSLGNAIYLSDSSQEVAQKVHAMYTDPHHIKVSDPGTIEGNVVFQFLDVFHQDKQELQQLKAFYQRGGLGDMKLKKMLTQDINDLLEPFRQRRAQYTDAQLQEILDRGTAHAQAKACKKMQQVREVIFG